MIEENLAFLKGSVKRGDPAYGILSLTSDSLDTLRTHLLEIAFSTEQRLEFDGAMSEILTAMIRLDQIIK